MKGHHIRFPAELWARLEKLVKEKDRSDFIRAALEEKLEREETSRRLQMIEERLEKGGL
jgi:Arc/MetJ-type ribon-helix-helix transcriptional regulator